MATVIDALLVTLGLDATKFKAGAKQTDEALGKTSAKASKTSKEMEAWGKNAAASMSKLRNEVLALLTVFTAGVGIKNFVENTISSTASLGRLSQNLDMSAKDLAMWQLANKNAGGSVEGMTAQLKEAQQAVADYRLGKDNAANSAFFSSGGTDAAFKDAETLLRARADLTAKISQRFGVGVAQRKAGEFGISDDTFNLLKQGSAQVDRLRMAHERLAAEQARASGPTEEFRKKLDSLKNNFEAIGVRILTSLMPQLDRFADWLAKNQDKIEEWANRVARAIEDFVKWANEAAESVGGWKNVLMALVAIKVLTMVSPLISLAGALVQVGTALGAIGGASGTGALAVLGKLARVGGVGAALGLHSGELNAGEADELAKRRALGDADFAKRGIGPDGKPLAPGGGAQSQVIDSMMAKGWTREQAVGIAANLKRESNFNPAAVGDSGKAIGVAQWHPDRQANFKAQYGKDLKGSTLEEQLAFIDHELRKGTEKPAGERLKSAESAKDAAEIMSRYYERPQDREGEASRRGVLAQQIDGQERARSLASAANLPAAAKMAAAGGTSNSASTSTSEININGPINIATQATDADGIAKRIKQALTRYAFAGQANTGLA
jgi:Phage tail lysozyme